VNTIFIGGSQTGMVCEKIDDLGWKIKILKWIFFGVRGNII
jgi:hypothetical protein